MSKRNIILLIVLAIIIAVFLYITEFKFKPIGWQPQEVALMDKPPDEVLSPQGQINFGSKLPKGFPFDMPIDSQPVRVLQSSFSSSQNPPPELNYDLTAYSYITRQDAKETFDVFTDYAVRNGFAIELKEEVGQTLALFGSKGENEKLNITIYTGNEGVTVTITFAKKHN
ncbi:MAG: hypothetical protein HYT65_00470 [Candidatus Yanofskybacteria bacterium]|nr:hypothetical protein [Candidatus Yanofskybacteria bacterium]